MAMQQCQHKLFQTLNERVLFSLEKISIQELLFAQFHVSPMFQPGAGSANRESFIKFDFGTRTVSGFQHVRQNTKKTSHLGWIEGANLVECVGFDTVVFLCFMKNLGRS